jgi:effector-binding domain-containing protein
MLTVPKIVDYPDRPYVAIPSPVRMDEMQEVAPKLIGEIWEWVRRKGLEPTGMTIVKYDVIDMNGTMQLEFGVTVSKPAMGDGRVVSGTLPAGRYAEIVYTGPFDALYDANAVLVGWTKERGHEWDYEERPDGDHFVCRYENYVTDPMAEPDPSKWVTEIAIKVK